MKNAVKKILLTLSTVMLFAVVLCFNASALEATGSCGAEGDNVTWRYNSETKELVISGTGKMAVYNTVNENYDVDSPFYQSDIKSLVIESGVTVIGSRAFCDCDSLESVTFPEGLISIGYSAFRGCDSIENLVFPESLEIIYHEAFLGCDSLDKVTFKSGVNISYMAFGGCDYVTEVTLLDKTISTVTFNYGKDHFITRCYKNSAAHKYLAEIGECFLLIDGEEKDYVFSGNMGRLSWKLDKRTGVLEINGKGSVPENNPWSEYSRYVTTIKYSEGITDILKDHKGYSNLKAVVIPDSVTAIDEKAFYFCRCLRSVTMGKGVKSIGHGAFEDCEKMESVYITDIGKWVEIDFADSNSSLPYGSDLYLNGKLVQNVSVPKGVKAIKNYAFNGCNSLESITILDSVTSIGDEAFMNCDKLKTITVGKGVTSIGNEAFCYCYSLENITIPNSVTSIGNRVFCCCDSLKSIIIPDSVTSIGDEAFMYCDKLKTITIGKGVTSIGNGVFQGCNSLKSITIPDSVTYIGDEAFMYCDNLKTITIGNGVTSIGNRAFDSCYSMESLTIPLNVKSIGSGAVSESTEKLFVYSRDCVFAEDCGIDYADTLYGYKGSTAEKFADDKLANFIDIETVHTHKTVTIKAIAPTYTKTGLTAGKKCTVCGKVTVKQKKVAKKKLNAVTISSVKSSKKATANITWKKVTDASGYVVEYSTSKKFTKKTTKKVIIKKGKTIKTTLKKLKSGKKYYVRIKAYKTINKKSVYSSYSKVKTVKIK